MIYMVVYIIYAAFALFVAIPAFTKGKKQYENMAKALDKKEYPLAEYIGVGLYTMERFKLAEKLPVSLRGFYNKHKMNVKSNIGMLYGAKNQETRYILHEGNSYTFSVAVLLFTALLSIVSSASGKPADGVPFVVIGLILSIAMLFLFDNKIETQLEEKADKIRMEFPEFLNKLTLLVNAGMTISRAFNKIMDDNKKNNPLYQELEIVRHDVQSGMSEAGAFEAFAHRCKIREIINFVSVMVLNLRRGGSEVVPVLRAQSTECWEMRKAVARRLGEQASSKMLLPLALMLIGIIVVVGAPAIMMMNGM